MPKKPNIKEWLLEQQRKLEQKEQKKPSKSQKPSVKKLDWIEQWNKEQEEADEKYKQKGVEKKLPKSKQDIVQDQWERYLKPDPIRKFPTSSGELYHGRVPEYSTLAKLRDMGVDTIWNLGAELAVFVRHEEAYVDHVIQGDIPDYGIPSNAKKFLNQAQVVVSLLKRGKKVFIHCHGGSGRTSMALAAIQLLMSDDNGLQALTKANAAAHGPDTDQQDAFIERLALYLKRPASPNKAPIISPSYDEYLGKSKAQDIVSREQGEIDKIISRYEKKKPAQVQEQYKPSESLAEKIKREYKSLLEKAEASEYKRRGTFGDDLTDAEYRKFTMLENWLTKHKIPF